LYATFRDEEEKKKRYKKKLLKQWRKETFGDPNGIQMPADWKPTGEIIKKFDEAVRCSLSFEVGRRGKHSKLYHRGSRVSIIYVEQRNAVGLCSNKFGRFFVTFRAEGKRQKEVRYVWVNEDMEFNR